MDGFELHQGLYDAIRDADALLSAIREDGQKLADAEREYRIALCNCTLVLRAQGFQVSLISDCARGSEKVANLKHAVMSAEAIYKADYEALLVAKKKVDVIEKEIEREWSNAGK